VRFQATLVHEIVKPYGVRRNSSQIVRLDVVRLFDKRLRILIADPLVAFSSVWSHSLVMISRHFPSFLLHSLAYLHVRQHASLQRHLPSPPRPDRGTVQARRGCAGQLERLAVERDSHHQLAGVRTLLDVVLNRVVRVLSLVSVAGVAAQRRHVAGAAVQVGVEVVAQHGEEVHVAGQRRHVVGGLGHAAGRRHGGRQQQRRRVPVEAAPQLSY